MDLALMLHDQGEWEGVLYFTSCALDITVRPRSYICEAASWGSLPYDLRAMAFYRTGAYAKAVEAVKKALELEPENQRLKSNLEIMSQAVESVP